MRELRQACRTILRRPLFAAVAISCLGLGIGGTAAIFSLADTILWKSLAVEHANELAVLGFTAPVRPEPRMTISYPMAAALRSRIDAFTDIGVYRSMSLNLRMRGQTDRVIVRGCRNDRDSSARYALGACERALRSHFLSLGSASTAVFAPVST